MGQGNRLDAEGVTIDELVPRSDVLAVEVSAGAGIVPAEPGSPKRAVTGLAVGVGVRVGRGYR